MHEGWVRFWAYSAIVVLVLPPYQSPEPGLNTNNVQHPSSSLDSIHVLDTMIRSQASRFNELLGWEGVLRHSETDSFEPKYRRSTLAPAMTTVEHMCEVSQDSSANPRTCRSFSRRGIKTRGAMNRRGRGM